MRKHAKSWLIKIFFGVIVFVFVFWGVGSFREGRRATIASVNGEPISIDQYQDTYKMLVDRYRQQLGENFNENMLKSLNIEKQAMERVVTQEVMLQEAKRLNLKVSDKELAEFIQGIEAFRQNGSFSQRLYERVLTYNKLDPETFEMLQKEALLQSKLRNLIVNSAKISDLEAKNWYDWKNAKVKIDYVTFSFDDYKEKVDLKPEEISAYYEENKESYKTEPMVNVDYLYVGPEDFLADVEVSEEEVQNYYRENISEFEKEKTVKARHILLKLDEDSDEALVEKRRKEAVEIMEKARAGEDFAGLAKEYSEGPTGSKGGDLGEFGKGQMVKPFSDAAFSLEAGEISDPVKTQFGWHIIKVEAVNEARVTPLEKAKEDIRKKLAEKKAGTLARERFEEVYDMTFDVDHISGLEDMGELEVKTTGFFSRKKGPADISLNGRLFAQKAFELQENEISDMIEIDDGYLIMEMVEKKPAEIAPFEEVKEEARLDLMEKRKKELAGEDARALLSKAKENGSLKEATAGMEKEVKTTEYFERSGSIPGIGYEREIVSTAFSLSSKKPLPEKILQGRKGYYVICFTEKKLPEESEFENEKENVKEQLLAQKQNRYFADWLSGAKNRKEITYNQDIINFDI